MKSRTPLAFSTIPSVKEVAQDPISALIICREARRSFEIASRKHLAKMYRVCFVAAIEMDRDYDKWKTFVKEANQMKVLKRKIRRDKDAINKLLFVCRFVFGWTHSYDRAWKIARALQFVAVKTSDPAELMAQLKQHKGIEGLYNAAVETLPRKGKTAEQISAMEGAYRSGHVARLEELRKNPLDDIFAGLDDGERLEEPVASDAVAAPLVLQPTDFVIEATPEQLQSLLIDKRRRHRLKIKRVGSSTDSWKRFKLVNWTPVPKTPKNRSEDLA